MDNQGYEPGLEEKIPTKFSIIEIVNQFVRDMFYHPTKPEIQDWVDSKALEFAREESDRSRLNPTKWWERYIYTDIHEILFCEFHVLL